MADISASDVMKLRKMSGQGMMDCKVALAESAGNVDKAMEILRKKGLATLEKRAGRETTQGAVVTKAAGDKKTAVLVSLCCETDFVAKSEAFVEMANKLADYAFACKADEGVENVANTEIDGKKFQQFLTDLVSQTGEKTEVGDYVRLKVAGAGIIWPYIHFNKKVGVLVQIETDTDAVAASQSVKEAANDIAMHIAAINPLALDKNEIPADAIEREKAIYAEQVKGKPANIIDKIVDGKLEKFFSEQCLLRQPFVKDDSKTVGEIIAQAGKAAGGKASVKRFVRFSVE